MNEAAPAIHAQRRRAWPQKAGGAGTLLLFLLMGCILCAWSVVGGAAVIAAAIGLFAFTSRGWICGNCRNPIAGGEVSVCPSCKAELS